MKQLRNILVIPDSFKGSLTSRRFCEIARKAAARQLPDAKVTAIPVADGGEGTVEALLAAGGGKRVKCSVSGPFFQPVQSFFGLLPDGTAIIEMAAAAGLPLAGNRLDPMQSTTFGVGELMARACEMGCKRIVLGMGGSATNDGGCGAAAALGVRFYNRDGETFIPTGGSLLEIARIDCAALRLPVPVIAMCDVAAPLYGEKGAARVFGPQKGADPRQVELLDAGLAHYARLLEADCRKQVACLPGAGAAGGLGAAALAFFSAKLQSGIETVLDLSGADSLLENADLVLTGEGRLDAQSLMGKVVVGVARRAQRHGVPVVAVVGDVAQDIDPVYAQGVSAVFSINRVAVPVEQAQRRSEQDLYDTLGDLFRFAGLFLDEKKG